MRVKICGITNVADGIAAAQFGADAIGLNFFPQSPRHVDEATAREIVRALPLFTEPIPLFVEQPLTAVVAWATRFSGIRTAQVHAHEHEIPPASDIRFIPAFSVRDRQSIENIKNFMKRCVHEDRMPAALLVDAHVAGEYGGTGRTAPWPLLAEFQPEVPLMLAGGLTPDNVAEAIRTVRPFAVDVASGVESSPGVKDHDKMRCFIDAAKNVANLD